MTADALLGILALTASPDGSPQSMMVDPTDVGALVAMALLSIHRIELRGTDPRAFPMVAAASFEEWRDRAVSAKSLAINACFLKFVVSNAWFFAARGRVPFNALRLGGALVFVTWLGALAYSFLLSRSAKQRAAALGIVPGRRIIEEKVTRNADGDVSAPGAEEESSR